MARRCLQQIVPVGNSSDDLVTSVLEQPRESLPDDRGILCDHDAHLADPYARSGSSTATTVGPSRGLWIESAPSIPRTRSSSPFSPLPIPSAAPPTPSSITRTRSRLFWPITSTSARLALLCFATFTRSSATLKYAIVSIAGVGRLAAGEGISEVEALRRVRSKSRKRGHRRQFSS